MSNATNLVGDLIARARAELRAERVPLRATYRVQFHPAHFGLNHARELVGYLDRLGVSHLYAAPHLRCRPGSTHGYDVVDHGKINSELGTESDLASLHAALADRDMSMLVDWVPNHMGTGAGNAQWMDVLENGPSSAYARFFDVDWRPVKAPLTHRVLVPILGDHYGLVLERGEIAVGYADGVFTVSYWDHRFPVGPRGYAMLLELNLDRLRQELSQGQPGLVELESILTAVKNLPSQTETDPDRLVERRREKEVIKRRLAELVRSSPRIRKHLDEALLAINGTPGCMASFDRLHALLEMQGYRLAYWRVAAEEVNYRRFFDINELVALRMEDPSVFQYSHRLLCSWIARGWIQAVRIDHPDGLFDPRAYFVRLKAAALAARCRKLVERDGGAGGEIPDAELEAMCQADVRRHPRSVPEPLTLFVEKILSREERLPPSWSVTGTTGYDFLNSVNGLFVDERSARPLDRLYARITGESGTFAELVRGCKELILESSLISEVQVLAHRLDEISEDDPRTRDFTLGNLRAALVETIASFPVYRTYVDSESGQVHARDHSVIEHAIATARARLPVTSSSVFDFLRDVLLARSPSHSSARAVAERRAFLGKFQQLTPPAMAKGIEDTAFYRYNRLVSLNEVGGEPEAPPAGVDDFHARNRQRQEQGLLSLLATSTHDTKRSEDARTRIDAISELPDAWGRAVLRWMRMALPGAAARPAAADEYLFYQSLLAVWPLAEVDGPAREELAERLEQYLIKAAREAKVHTSWINPSETYEQGLAALVRGVLFRPRKHAFWSSFLPLQSRISWAGMNSSLAQVVLKVAAPGVPDFYQGCELWNFRLVDPDNRQPIDHTIASERLADLERAHETRGPERLVAELAAAPADGRAKLYVTWRALQLRRALATAFDEGNYVPLAVVGARARHVVAFARVHHDTTAIAVVGRLWSVLAQEAGLEVDRGTLALPGLAWGDTRVVMPVGTGDGYRDAFTARFHPATEELLVRDLLTPLPVALLHAPPAGGVRKA